MMRNQYRWAALGVGLVCALSGRTVWGQHEDIFIGHSPPDPDPPMGEECPTLEPLKLFLADNETVGGAIPPGGGEPASSGAIIELLPVAFNANLADPARGGFLFAENQPGLNYIGVDNPCHGMSTSFTGGQYFETGLERLFFDDGVNLAMTRNVTPILNEDGTSWTFGNSNDGGHMHPFFLAHRAGNYLAEFRVSASIVFIPSDEFTLRYRTSPKCFAAEPVDMSAVFNADVIDSDAEDDPVPFDAGAHYWVLDGLYGTDRGISVDGVLDVFQLGGPEGAQLATTELNCLFDDGTYSSQAAIDLTQQGVGGEYFGVEVLIGATGDFTCTTGQPCESLTMHMTYASGGEQTVNLRRLALPASFEPIYVPLNDWYVSETPAPRLSVGPSGRREGGGFVRSDGSAIDTTSDPVDAFYFQRVTFPLDGLRSLLTIEFDDYVDGGTIGVFAVTLLREDLCRDGDFDGDGDVDLDDYAEFVGCATVPGEAFGHQDCAVFDVDADADVDVRDFGQFQSFFTGEPN